MDVCARGELGSNAGSSISISLPAVTRILGAGALRKLNTIFFFFFAETARDLDPVNEHDEPFAAMFRVHNLLRIDFEFFTAHCTSRQPIIAVVADAVSFCAADNVDSKRINVIQKQCECSKKYIQRTFETTCSVEPKPGCIRE